MTAMAREMAEQPEVIGALLDRREEFAARLRAIAPEPLTGVILIARGSSDNAAIYGRYVLEAALRRPVSLAAPSLWTRYGLAEDLRGYLAVGVSQSGKTPEITDTLERVKAAGAAAVAVTNDGGSPLAEIADEAIDLDVGPEQAVPATKTVTAQLAAFAILAHALGEPLWPEEAWAAVPRAQAEVLAGRRRGGRRRRGDRGLRQPRPARPRLPLRRRARGRAEGRRDDRPRLPGLLGRRLPPRPDRDRARGHDRGRLRRARAGRQGRPRGRGARPRGRRTADRGRRRGG